MHNIETEIIVPFHDVDSMEIVWHGHYVKYLEVARCLLLESFNYDYRQMHASGYAWPVIDMRIKYVKPLRFQQKIVVSATLEEWEHRLKVNYLISDAQSGTRLAKAYTIQVAVSLDSQEMCFESPAILKERLGLTS